MKIGMLVPDNRDELRRYEEPAPFFGQAVTALLQGLQTVSSECEVHIVCAVQKPVHSPEQIAGNIYYHSILVPKSGWLRGAYAGCVCAIRKKLREIEPDLVHGQGTERYCGLSAVFSGFPNVLTIHGNMRLIAEVTRARTLSFAWLAARLERFTLPRTGGVICISSYTQHHVSRLVPKTWLVPNAVDAAFFEVIRNPVQPRQLLCLGHIIPRKNQIELIRLMEPLATRHQFELVFYGNAVSGDTYVESFLELVKERSWCRFAGLADAKGVRTALSDATMLILPSLEDNCPIAVLEAMAAGVPVAAAEVGGVPDLISHGEDGLLFDPGDGDSVRAAVTQILGNDDEAARISRSARDKARRCFHPTAIARRHIDIYEQMIRLKRG